MSNYEHEIAILEDNIAYLEEQLKAVRLQASKLVLERGGDVLKVPMLKNDVGAKTIGEYLKALLWTLWEKGESFNSKRPFGNGGWEYDLYRTLIKNGLIAGELDENDGVERGIER